jgi:hypothetical protein
VPVDRLLGVALPRHDVAAGPAGVERRLFVGVPGMVEDELVVGVEEILLGGVRRARGEKGR